MAYPYVRLIRSYSEMQVLAVLKQCSDSPSPHTAKEAQIHSLGSILSGDSITSQHVRNNLSILAE
jgi:hypothetical protein